MPIVGYDIDLYEDNAGNLYLHPMTSNWVYQTDPYLDPDFDFENECRELYEHEHTLRLNWSVGWIHSYSEIMSRLHHSETHLIATWHNDAPYTLHRWPGHAGQKYLQLSDKEV